MCLSACLSIHPFILLSVSARLFSSQLHLIKIQLLSKNTCKGTNSPLSLRCLQFEFSKWMVSSRGMFKDPYCVITFVTISLLSAHNSYCQLQNYTAVKSASFTLQQHQHTLFGSLLLEVIILQVLPHLTIIQRVLQHWTRIKHFIAILLWVTWSSLHLVYSKRKKR